MFKVCENGIFKSIQGEGANCGRSAVFVRFYGCNQSPLCDFCDEQIEDYVEKSQDQIIQEIERLEPFSIVVLTGGEPTIQSNLERLVDELHVHHYFVTIETNGLRKIPSNIDWITCSPKQKSIDSSIISVNEIKLIVTGSKEEVIEQVKLIKQQVKTDYIYLQPVSNQKESILRCVELISDNPELRLSVQVHKLINIR